MSDLCDVLVVHRLLSIHGPADANAVLACRILQLSAIKEYVRHETQILKGQYQPRGGNILQTILTDHIDAFSLSYEENYAADYGRFNLNRIADRVDYSLGMARIKCSNDDCGYEYFHPFSRKQWYLCPSCHQKRLLLFSERMPQQTLLKLPHRQFVFTVPKILRPFFRHNKKLFSEVSRIISLILTRYYSGVTGKELDTGVVSAFQTCGDRLRFNPHWVRSRWLKCRFCQDGKKSTIA